MYKRQIKDEEHVVVLGDLNSPLSAVMNHSPLSNCGLQSHPQPSPTYPSWQPSRIIDQALVSESLEINEYDVLDCHLSDHRPVAVEVSLRGTRVTH